MALKSSKVGLVDWSLAKGSEGRLIDVTRSWAWPSLESYASHICQCVGGVVGGVKTEAGRIEGSI